MWELSLAHLNQNGTGRHQKLTGSALTRRNQRVLQGRGTSGTSQRAWALMRVLGEDRPTLHLALKKNSTDVPVAALTGTPVLRGAVMSFRRQEVFHARFWAV